MKKEMRKSSVMGAKVVISIMLIVSMLCTLCACGKDDKPSDNREPVTSVSELPKDGLGVDEPGQEIDPGFEAPTTTTTETQQNSGNGSYSYTIYDGFTVTMDIDINDYIVVNDYGMFLQLYDLATDLGWSAIDGYPGNVISVPRYTFDCGNGCTMLFDFEAYGQNIDGKDYPQLHNIWVKFVTTGDYSVNYYSSSSDATQKNVVVNLDEHYAIDEYRLNGKGYGLCHDDVVLIAYILWACSENPGQDPLANVGVSNVQNAPTVNEYTIH